MNTKIFKFISLVILSLFIVAGGIYYFSTSKEIIYIAGYQKKSAAPPVLFEIDYVKGTVNEHHPFNFVTRPKSIDIAIDEGKLYAGGIGKGIDVIDLNNLERIESLPLKGPIRGMVVTREGDKLFIPNPKRYGENTSPELNSEFKTVVFETENLTLDSYLSKFVYPYFYFDEGQSFFSYAWPFVKFKYSVKEDTFVYKHLNRKQVLNNGGIQPAGMKITTPFPMIENNELSFYDRDNGRITKRINLKNKLEFKYRDVSPKFPVLSNDFQKCFFIIHGNNSKKLAVIDLNDKQILKVVTITSKNLSEMTNITTHTK